MAINETLKRYLEYIPPPGESYADKLRPFYTDAKTELWEIAGLEDFQDHLRSCGITSYQKAGITRILGSAGHVVLRDEKDNYLDSYKVTVGDVQLLSDKDLGKLTGERGVEVLRKLFGSLAESEDEPEIPPFLKNRLGK